MITAAPSPKITDAAAVPTRSLIAN
jgi:hypothetical protein